MAPPGTTSREYRVQQRFVTPPCLTQTVAANRVYTARWRFRAPTSGGYKFSTSHPTGTDTPLTDAARFCLRKAPAQELPAAPEPTECIGTGTVDQRFGMGGWLHIMGGVPLTAAEDFEMVLTWDSRHGGFAAADALLVESEAFLCVSRLPQTCSYWL